MEVIQITVFVSMVAFIFFVAAVTGMIKSSSELRMRDLRDTEEKKIKKYVRQETRHNFFTSIGRKIAYVDPEKRTATEKKLMKAGYYGPSGYYTYWGIKMITTVAVPVSFAFLLLYREMPPSLYVPAFGLLALIGFLLPNVFLYFKIKGRQEAIFCGLPDMLDLLVICLEAGLGLNAALQKVSEDMEISNKVLSDELKITTATIRLGVNRMTALHDLGQRTGVDDLIALIAVLVQSEKFGTGLAQAMRVLADDMRTRRRQRAEELAAKTTVKLAFPLVCLILPATFIIVAGPAIIKIYELFINKQ